MTVAWLTRRLTVPCSIFMRLPSDTPDEYGNVVYDTVAVHDTTCFLQPVTEIEIQQGRASAGTFTLYLGAEDAPYVDSFGAFIVDERVYEAVGHPSLRPSLLRPGIHHVEITVQRSTA